MWGGDVQGGEWHGRVQAVPGGDVLDRDGGDLGGSVQRVSGARGIGGGEQQSFALHLRRGVHRTGRRGVCGMWRGDAQGCQRLGSVHTMPWRDIQRSDSGHERGNVQ